MRIVSLLPSATEILCGLGLRGQLVGVTDQCDHPAEVKQIPKVTRARIPDDADSVQIDQWVREQSNAGGALYSLDRDLLESLAPDLIVTQGLCEVCAVAPREVESAACSLASRPQVISLQPTSLEEVIQCVGEIARAAKCDGAGRRYEAALRNRVARVSGRFEAMSESGTLASGESSSQRSLPTVMLLEWIDPPFSAGHWNPELVRLAGGHELMGETGERSVAVDWPAIVAADPDVIVIACCGFDVDRTMQDVPILQSHPGWDSLRCVRNGQVHVMDGSAYFNRPGPRLVDSLEILAHTLHPGIQPLPDGLPAAIRIGASSQSD